jgi:Leucine-rich repeat (LRR) protein
MVDLGWVIGTVAVKWAIKLWSKDDPLVELGAEIGDVLANSARDVAARRRTSNQFNMIAELVNERIDPLLSADISGVEANERTSAILAAGRALDRGLSITASFDAGLDSAVLATRIRDADNDTHKNDALSEAAETIYDTIIAESAAYSLQLASKLPAFTLESTRAMLGQTNAIVTLAERILAEMPESRVPASWGSGTDFQRFESRYLRAIFEQANRLRLYGVTNITAQAPYALSTAYIPLQASPEEKDGHGDAAPISIDAALNLSRRLLISGDAGSGKTTLLQWITITASSASFEQELTELNGTVPFVLPLRRFGDGQFPPPEDWLKHITPSLAGGMPPLWMHNILSEGRALILVDGFDEVSDSVRSDAVAWLQEIEQTFPDNFFVLTSRDVAVERSWTRPTDYARVRLLPMQYGEIRTFIEHWHAAALQADSSPEHKSSVSSARIALLAAVRDRPSLRVLADSPLLCALICAMNLEGGSQLPADRMELYGTALQMLVTRRDRDRKVSNDVVDLSFGEASLLLEEFAYWMQDNRLADCSYQDFENRVSSVLPRLHRVQHEGGVIAQYLLERSGVLREPVVGRVEFIHRTFLEYLAAKAIIAGDSIPKLIHVADDDYWREVVILAAGHAAPVARDRLLRGLIQRGLEEPTSKHLLFLVAVSCMETSNELAPDLLDDLNTCLAEVIPPHNMTDASAIAAAGDMAVPLLAKKPKLALEAAAAVRSLCLIGSDAALAALRNYAGDRRLTVSRQVLRGWSDFDTEQYARDILSQSPLERGSITITEPEFAIQAHHLSRAENITLHLGSQSRTLTEVEPNAAVRDISAPVLQDQSNLNWVAGFPNLERLSLLGSKLKSLVGIEPLQELVYLDIEGTNITSLSPLSGISSLRWLDIAKTSVWSLTGIPEKLAYLRVADCNGLNDVTALREVDWLDLSDKELAVLSAFIAESPSLQRLHIRGRGDDLPPLAISSSVTDLALSRFDRVFQLPEGAESLKTLSLSGDDLQADWPSWLVAHSGLLSARLTFESIPNIFAGIENVLTIPSIHTLRVSSRSIAGPEKIPEVDGFRRIGRGRIVSYIRL